MLNWLNYDTNTPRPNALCFQMTTLALLETECQGLELDLQELREAVRLQGPPRPTPSRRGLSHLLQTELMPANIYVWEGKVYEHFP